MLREQAESIVTALGAFRELLPLPSVHAIDNFAAKAGKLVSDTAGTPDQRQERVWAALVLLAAFETEMSFLLSDVQESIHARSERAFSHLQRSIVVDREIRAKWRKAFDDGEVACERLGAVHLLLHGIWAFKVDAVGARTDLVYQEPPDDLMAVERYADGLVLTEWKIARSDSDAGKRFDEARSQAGRYAEGPLATTELRSYRYVVVVSQRRVEVPPDRTQGGVVYRHINVPVDPQVPSRG